MKQVRIGLLGCGTVGGGFVRLLEAERGRIRNRYGMDLVISGILVRDVAKKRHGLEMSALRCLLTDRALDILDGECDLVVEVIGGVHTAGALIRRAIARGRNIVTANKALLASSGTELFAAAARMGVRIGFEASVCGGVPIIGALRGSLAGDSIESISGVLNGTSNYVLCRMAEGLALEAAIRRAQEAGFAEEDPTLDISGEDAAQKLAILAQIAFGTPASRSSVRGIESITGEDLANAAASGFAIRQVAEARRVAGSVRLVVEPRRLPLDHPFARVLDEQNAVLIRGRASGEIGLSGPGAGSMPTAVAILGDVLALGRSVTAGRWARRFVPAGIPTAALT